MVTQNNFAGDAGMFRIDSCQTFARDGFLVVDRKPRLSSPASCVTGSAADKIVRAALPSDDGEGTRGDQDGSA